MINRRGLFVCSCIALITSAFTFVVRGDILQEMGNAFQLSQEQKGGIEGAVFMGMALSMLFGGFICDLLGMKRIMFLAFGSHLIGSVATIFAPHSDFSYQWLFVSSLLMGFGNGFTEVGINPLIATLYPDKKTHYLNMLHAWWPGGLVIGGLSAQFVVRKLVPEGVAGLELWQTSLCLIALPAIAYGVMLIPARFPQTERVESGVSTADMFKECLRPLFLIWGFCMLLTAATELGPQKWQESVMRSTAGVSGTLILVYTSGMMFVLRHFAGPIAHKISPVGMMLGSAVLSGIGLYALSYADSAITAIGFATIFGLGITFFWPTMLGVTAERFPKGGALALALMGSIGNLSISQVLPQMGHIVDTYAVRYVEETDKEMAPEILKRGGAGAYVGIDPGAVEKLPEDSPGRELAAAAQSQGYRMAFRWVSLLPSLLIVIFTGIILYDRSQGGYKAEILISRDEEDELFAGGVQGAVE
jgi:MFS family permease